jgi:catechol 2,3-dioxygenase-like lactoylglutathione lyase family enzyme
MAPEQPSRRDFVKSCIGAAASAALVSSLRTEMGAAPLEAAQLQAAAPPEFISNIRESTISTDSLEESVHYYREHFGFHVVRSADLNDDVWRRLWQLPYGHSAKAVLMEVPGHDIGSIRLVQFSPLSKIYAHLPHRSLTTGYGGMDMEVPDMTTRFEALVRHGHARVNAPIQYEPPKSGQTLTESVVIGPSGERLPMVIYRDVANNNAPMPATPEYRPVLAVFQVVEDLQGAKQAYLRLGLQITRERETSIPEVNRALGLPVDTRYRAYQLGNPNERFARPILVQFLNKSVDNLSDFSNPPNLGLLMTSHKVRDMEEGMRRLETTEAKIMAGPLEIDNGIYDSTIAMTFKQSNGAWVELYT